MKAYHAFIINKKISAYEALIQLYAVIVHKAVNPKIPIILLTDKKSLGIYKELQLDTIYDDIRTDVFDDYPYNRISQSFKSAPKIWAISKLSGPFFISDTDLIYHRPLNELELFEFAYLYKETSNSYLRPFEITKPNGFEWSMDMLYNLRISNPINASVLYFNDELLKNDFTEKYFEFVLDNIGEIVNVPSELLSKKIIVRSMLDTYIPKNAVSIFAERALLGAVTQKWHSTDYTFKAGQILPFFYNSVFFNRISNNENVENVNLLLNESFYHLSDLKEVIQNDECNCKLPKLAEMIIKSGKEFLDNANCWDEYGHIYERYKNEIIQSLQTVDSLVDTKK